MHQQEPVAVEEIGSDDRIGDTGLVLETEEDEAAGGAGTLAANHAAGGADTAAVGQALQVAGADDSLGVERGAAVAPGMRADRQASAVKVGHQALLVGHARQRRRDVGLIELVEQRPGTSRGAGDLPQRIATMKTAELPNCRTAELGRGTSWRARFG